MIVKWSQCRHDIVLDTILTVYYILWYILLILKNVKNRGTMPIIKFLKLGYNESYNC